MWGTYLFVGVDGVAGYVGLLLWWVTTAIGLLILMRLMRRNADVRLRAGRTSGPRDRGVATVGHLGALVGAIVWTTFFVMDKY